VVSREGLDSAQYLETLRGEKCGRKQRHLAARGTSHKKARQGRAGQDFISSVFFSFFPSLLFLFPEKDLEPLQCGGVLL